MLLILKHLKGSETFMGQGQHEARNAPQQMAHRRGCDAYWLYCIPQLVHGQDRQGQICQRGSLCFTTSEHSSCNLDRGLNGVLSNFVMLQSHIGTVKSPNFL